MDRSFPDPKTAEYGDELINTYFCYLRGAVVPGDVVTALLPHDLGFVPQRLAASALNGGRRDLAYDLSLVERLRGVVYGHLMLHGENRARLTLSGVSSLAAELVVLKSPSWPSPDLVDAAAGLPGFVSALSGDSDDLFWQSMTEPQTYEMYKRPWKHLPWSMVPVLNRPRIDVSQNPGRQSVGPGMWMWAAARMRFGAGAFLVLDRERLLDCPVGVVAEQHDGTVTVELFDLDDDLEVIRDRQRTFRDWMGYDDIEDRILEYVPVKAPAMEFDRTSRECTVVTEWLNDGRLAFADAANQRRVTRYDIDGAVQSQETFAVDPADPEATEET